MVYLYFSTTPREAAEVYKSLLTRYLMENMIREERGLESVDPPSILLKLEQFLSISISESHRVFHEIEDELWEYSWYNFTNEWAWFRAENDVKKEIEHLKNSASQESIEKLVEHRFEEHFDTYLKEIDMRSPVEKHVRRGKKTRR